MCARRKYAIFHRYNIPYDDLRILRYIDTIKTRLQSLGVPSVSIQPDALRFAPGSVSESKILRHIFFSFLYFAVFHKTIALRVTKSLGIRQYIYTYVYLLER